MKLHLPKKLFVAVLAACVVCPTALAGTGWGSLDGKNYLYIGGDAGGNGIDGTTGVTNVTWVEDTKTVNAESISAVTKGWTDFGIVADKEGVLVNGTVEELVVKKDAAVRFCTNPWHDATYAFNGLVLQKLSIEEGGSISLNNEVAQNIVAINTVVGSISSITNTGRMELGTEVDVSTTTINNTGTLVLGATTSFSTGGQLQSIGRLQVAAGGNVSINTGDTHTLTHTLTNNGSLTITDALRIDDVSSFTVKNDSNSSILEGQYSDGANGYAMFSGVEYYLVDGEGTELSVSADTITMGESTVIALDKTSETGKISFVAGSTFDNTSIYYVNEGTVSTSLLSSTASGFHVEKGAVLKFTDELSGYPEKAVTGEGEVQVQFEGGNHSKGIKLGTDFNGTLSILSGHMELGSFSYGTDAKLKLVSGQNWNNATINNEVLLEAADIDSSYDFAYSTVTINGKVTGNFLQVTGNDNGSLTLTNSENDIDGIKVSGRTLNLQAGSVGELDITGGVVNLTGTASVTTEARVSEGATLKIAGSSESTNGANLVAASGAGDIIVSGNTKLISGEGNQETRATGKLTINSGATLTVGTSDLNALQGDEKNRGASIATFTQVVLDNGTLSINNPGATVQNLEVTSGKGYIHVYDVQNDTDSSGAYTDALFLTGTTTLNGELKYTNIWNSQVNIEKLSGTGNLVIDGTDRKTSDLSTFIIAGAENYTGEVQMVNGASNMTLDVADDLGLNVKYRTRSGQADLSQIGSGNTIHLAAFAGSIKSGTVEADVTINNANGTDGVYYAGAEILSATAGDKITYAGTVSGTGNYIVNTGDVSTTTEFTGDVSGWTAGHLRVASGSQNVTYTGDATNICHQHVVDENAELNLSMNHDKAVTVSGQITQGGGAVNLSVANSHADGTTFTNQTNIAKATIEDGSKVSFSHANVTVDDILVKTAAQLSFSAVESLSVATLEVQSGATVTVGTLENEKTLTVTSHATFSGGQVNANLAFADGAEVTLNQALSMGSSLSLGSDLTLSGEQYTAITSMTSGSEPVKLFTGVDTLTLGGDSYTVGSSTLDSSSGKDLSDYFSNVDSGKYYLGYNAAGDVYAGLIVPEPTTATLSLLALAGLMARRRRAK